jgi:hypothetical protein
MKTNALSRRYETFAAIDRRCELLTALDEIEREKVLPLRSDFPDPDLSVPEIVKIAVSTAR